MKTIWITLFVLMMASHAPVAESACVIDLGAKVSHTPYDSYLSPVSVVLDHLSGPTADMALVERLVREGRAFRYSYNSAQPYVPQAPEQTEATKSGDCKAKSLWLASKMNDRGVRFVIGKAKQAANVSHAWLIWNGPDGWMILDATLYSSPLSPAKLSPSDFLPLYSYSASGRFVHSVAAEAKGGKYGDHL